MDTSTLLDKIEMYVKRLFLNYDTNNLLYHNLTHTQLVVLHVQELANHYRLSNHSTFIAVAAAWFHDTGQLTGDMSVHEERSVQFMEDYFSDKNIPVHTISDIAQIIMATKMPVAPATQLEKIICDADTWHLGTIDFYRLDSLVWDELELRLKIKIDNRTEKSLKFLEAHQFYTEYCIQKLSDGEITNIELIKSFLKN